MNNFLPMGLLEWRRRRWAAIVCWGVIALLAAIVRYAGAALPMGSEMVMTVVVLFPLTFVATPLRQLPFQLSLPVKPGRLHQWRFWWSLLSAMVGWGIAMALLDVSPEAFWGTLAALWLVHCALSWGAVALPESFGTAVSLPLLLPAALAVAPLFLWVCALLDMFFHWGILQYGELQRQTMGWWVALAAAVLYGAFFALNGAKLWRRDRVLGRSVVRTSVFFWGKLLLIPLLLVGGILAGERMLMNHWRRALGCDPVQLIEREKTMRPRKAAVELLAYMGQKPHWGYVVWSPNDASYSFSVALQKHDFERAAGILERLLALRREYGADYPAMHEYFFQAWERITRAIGERASNPEIRPLAAMLLKHLEEAPVERIAPWPVQSFYWAPRAKTPSFFEEQRLLIWEFNVLRRCVAVRKWQRRFDKDAAATLAGEMAKRSSRREEDSFIFTRLIATRGLRFLLENDIPDLLLPGSVALYKDCRVINENGMATVEPLEWMNSYRGLKLGRKERWKK